MSDRDPGELLRDATCVLLDFDGPVCDLFAVLPATAVAERLRQSARRLRVSLPPAAAQEPDPLVVLQLAATVGAVEQIGDDLRRAEIEAAGSATPTSGAENFLNACRAVDRRVAIVSNNSAEAVRAYLARVGLDDLVTHVQGRGTVEEMKPNPRPLLAAVQVLHAGPGDCVMIGDSTCDILAAKRAKVPTIGYANKHGKADRLAVAGADAITTSMLRLSDALTPRG